MKPRLEQWNPIDQAGPVSCLDVHSPLESPAPTVDPPACSDIGALDHSLDDYCPEHGFACTGHEQGIEQLLPPGPSGNPSPQPGDEDYLTDPDQSPVGAQWVPWQSEPGDIPKPRTTPFTQITYGRPTPPTPPVPYSPTLTAWGPPLPPTTRQTGRGEGTAMLCQRCRREEWSPGHICGKLGLLEDRIADAKQRTLVENQRKEWFDRQTAEVQARSRAFTVDDADIAFKIAVGHEQAVDEQRQADQQRRVVDAYVRTQVRRHEQAEAARLDATMSVDDAFNEFRAASRGRR
jgi:hypothetical protein